MNNLTTDDRRPDKSMPDSDATSKETVKDVTENEVQSSKDDSRPAPSPDGALDEKKETNGAGPM